MAQTYDNEGNLVDLEPFPYGPQDNTVVFGPNNTNILGTEEETTEPRNFLQKAFGNFSFKNIGSAEFDEDGFVMANNEPTEIINPNYGKIKKEGKGLFGKAGGFMSRFNTGRGALANFMKGDTTQSVGMGLLDISQSLMNQNQDIDLPFGDY